MKMVVVTWVDPTSLDAWDTIQEVSSYELHKIISVGILIKDTHDTIVLSLNYDAISEDVSCSIIIPKTSVITMKDLGHVEKELKA